MSGQRGFVMVPAWLLLKKPTGNDVLIYATLGSHGSWNPGTGCYDNCRPSIELMVEETGLSRSTVKRALGNLLKLGGVERTPQFTEEGDPAPSLYRVIFGAVVEPAAQLGVGSQTDRPPAAEKNTRSKGGRSTGEPGSVQGRTDGRSTDDPTVGPPVDRNQEPLNQDPFTKSSVPASQVRRTDDEIEQVSEGQLTIDGGPELTAEQQEKARKKFLEDTAKGIGRGWDEIRTKHDCPIVVRRGADPVMAIRNLVLPALATGYTENEIKNALAYLDTGIPSAAQLETALAAVKNGWRPVHGWKPGDGRRQQTRQRNGTGAMAGTNLHVDDLTPEQRAAENPFAGASRQSDYVDQGAVA